MSKKDYLNFRDSASTPTLSKKSTTLLLGLLVGRLSNLERTRKSERLFRMLTVTFMVAQSIALVTLGIVVSQKLEKTSTLQTAPSIQEAK
jgi:hypothetical protein|tara:strand:- start:1295 stop:1564 length:270 start_codon:yes stop_codon:yes gene_type:complete